MKISTEINSTSRIVGEEKAVELLAKAGFDAWDFSMFNMALYDWSTRTVIPSDHPLTTDNYADFAKTLRKIGEDNGIHCNQSHAPFPVCCKEIRGYLKRAIECTAIAGGSICIIHPDNNYTPQQNAEMYLELLPFAKEYNVKIATENMWNWNNELNQAAAAACSHHDNFLAHIEAVNDPYLVACLDLGHAEMKGLDTTAEKMILTLGKHLQALHIHDNDLMHDSHQIPFSMNMDFEVIAKALRTINYQGYLTLEADAYLKAFDADNVEQGVKNLAESARRFEKLITG